MSTIKVSQAVLKDILDTGMCSVRRRRVRGRAEGLFRLRPSHGTPLMVRVIHADPEFITFEVA